MESGRAKKTCEYARARTTGNTKTLKIDPTAQCTTACTQLLQLRKRADRRRQRFEPLVVVDVQFLQRREGPDRLGQLCNNALVLSRSTGATFAK
jgi:hypothetical protein